MLSFVVAISLTAAANARLFSMLDEVNRQLPKEARIDSLIGWNTYKVLGLHAEMYPESKKRWQMWALVLSGFAFLFGGFFASWVLRR
jgi:hypothetical protein